MAQSPELTGGAGFTFEDSVVAIYLAALLGDETAPGCAEGAVDHVAVQQAAYGQPLDDLVVRWHRSGMTAGRLSLQVKRELTISAAPSNTDFRDIVLRAWTTVCGAEFQTGVDRVGIATGTISEGARRALNEICEWARSSLGADTFLKRFEADGVAGEQRRSILDAFRTILADAPADTVDDARLHELLRHFVLIRFDLLHEGATDEADAIAKLQRTLHEGDPGRAAELWQRLRMIARDAAGRSGEFSRPSLLSQIGGSFHFSASPALRSAIAQINAESALALAGIACEIDGVEVPRTVLGELGDAQIRAHRFTQIVGLPGTGKSAVLKTLAEARKSAGTVFFLKSDRIVGPRWTAHAQSLGIAAVPIEYLLAEIAATGTAILFIDGIDRIEYEHRGVVLDLVNTILKSPNLHAWRIIATARDNGIEPLRTWLPPELFRDGGVGTVEVKPWDESEAEFLASKKPALRPILFGDARVKEIGRRPFFASVSARKSSLESATSVQSEVELLADWWARGGYDSDQARRPHRQRLLVQLAKESATSSSGLVGIANTSLDLGALHELATDGILTFVRDGHQVQFSHDIFFEWAFVQLLVGRGDQWLTEIRAAGEPPRLGRSVELLSQREFTRGTAWEDQLASLERSSMRPQWVRAWLLAPFGIPGFSDNAAVYDAALFREGTTRLRHLAVWFQAEKTKANPMVLAQSTGGDEAARRETVRMADIIAWPSDLPTWQRFCSWVIANIARCPVSAFPELLAAFEIWQNIFADYPNPVSQAIVQTVYGWLEDIEDRRHAQRFGREYGVWDVLRHNDLEEFEKALRTLFLRAARAEPLRVAAYLKRLEGREWLRHEAFEQVVLFAPLLAQTHPAELAVVVRAELEDELPEDAAAERRESEFAPLRGTVSRLDWDSAGIRMEQGDFFPASPLREPFRSLFQYAPDQARELVRSLTNHAITAWRQLYRMDWERRATPCPIVLAYPWGTQEFSGDRRVYLWPRGQWGPHPVECGLMALEHWAFAEVEKGRDIDDVIRDVVDGHQSSAVLSIAVALVLSGQRVSAVTLPLLTSQLLWHFDMQRYVLERSTAPNLIGFTKPSDRPHYDAVKAANERPARQLELRSVAMLGVIAHDEVIREAVQQAIQTFPQDLPFEFEEIAQNEEAVRSLRRTAEIWAEIGKPENYVAQRAPDGSGIYVKVENPTASDPDVKAVVARSTRMNEQAALFVWVHECFEKAGLSDRLTVSDAIERARKIDRPDLFTLPYHMAEADDMDSGAVAGVAAAVLAFAADANESELGWSEAVTYRAATTPEEPKHFFAGSHPFHHPVQYAANGLGALIRRNIRTASAKPALLSVASHPLEEISALAVREAMSCWTIDKPFAWSALNLGIRLSIGEIRDRLPSVYGYDHATTPARIREAVETAIAELGAPPSAPTLQKLPPPWERASATRPGMRMRGRKGQVELGWRRPDIFFRWDFMPKVLKGIPIGNIMADPDYWSAFVDFCRDMISWTVEHLAPSWRDADSDRHESLSHDLYEWRRSLFGFLGQVAMRLEVSEVEELILGPVFGLEDELATSLLDPLLDMVVCIGILDSPQASQSALAILGRCISRLLEHGDWRGRNRDGHIYGFDLPSIVRTVLMVRVEALGAVRFANGDWHDIGLVLPTIDPFIRAVGDIPAVTNNFLRLCERANEFYPASLFAEQMTAILAQQNGTPAGWHHSTIPSRIAAVVQLLAEEAHPLPASLARSLLMILDRLVDMGDRRSAALQISPIFKDVRF